MHVRDLCLCPECIARLSVSEDELRTRALVLIAATNVRHENTTQLADGVVKRRARAA